MTLAFSSGFVQTAPAEVAALAGVVSRYPYASLFVNVLCIYLYAALAFGVFVWASLARISPAPALEKSSDLTGFTDAKKVALNAQVRVAKSSHLVAELFPSPFKLGPGPRGWVKKDAEEMFNESTGVPVQLRLGFKHEPGSSAFGVSA